MHAPQPTAALLPYPAPTDRQSRLLLHAIRRMAVGGIDDAFAAHAFFASFGGSYRRPLMLVRVLMTEVARLATTRLVVAPCCCRRLSAAEHGLLRAIAAAVETPQRAHDRLTRLLHVHDCLGLVTCAQAVATSFADLGLPLPADSAVE